MVTYMQQGGVNEDLLNIELTMIKVVNMYLKHVKHNDTDKNRSILNQFIKNISEFKETLISQKKLNHGIYIVPMHRSFGFYITRLLMLNFIDPKQYKDIKEELPLEKVFRYIFVANQTQDLK